VVLRSARPKAEETRAGTSWSWFDGWRLGEEKAELDPDGESEEACPSKRSHSSEQYVRL
jgi:hypothetical protein